MVQYNSEEKKRKEFLVILQSIINARGDKGATINEIKEDYLELCGTPLYDMAYDPNRCLVNLINEIEGIRSHILPHGAIVYQCDSKKSEHVRNLCTRSRKRKTKSKSNYDSSFAKKKPKPTESNGHYYGYDLMGDDFFMSICRYNLDQNFKRNENGALCIGKSLSGLTLREAQHIVMTAPTLNHQIIINVGSVDLMNGRDLIDMKFDFLNLMSAFEYRNIRPIVTTLAPLANYCHVPTMRGRLQKFNEFLLGQKERWNILDIHSTFVTAQGQTLFSCYQPEPRKNLSGTNKSHVLWNIIGRGRVLQKIKNYIADDLQL